MNNYCTLPEVCESWQPTAGPIHTYRNRRKHEAWRFWLSIQYVGFVALKIHNLLLLYYVHFTYILTLKNLFVPDFQHLCIRAVKVCRCRVSSKHPTPLDLLSSVFSLSEWELCVTVTCVSFHNLSNKIRVSLSIDCILLSAFYL